MTTIIYGMDIKFDNMLSPKIVSIFNPETNVCEIYTFSDNQNKNITKNVVSIINYHESPTFLRSAEIVHKEVLSDWLDHNCFICNGALKTDLGIYILFNKHINIVGDPMLYCFLLPKQTEFKYYNLKYCMLHFGFSSYTKINYGEEKGFSPYSELTEKLLFASARDAKACYDLENKLVTNIPMVSTNTYMLELDVVKVLAQLKYNGIKIDLNTLDKIKANFMEIEKGESERLCNLAGKKINVNSTKQVSDLLFGALGLKPIKVTKSNKYSTDKEVLEGLNNPIADLILKIRSIKTKISDIEKTNNEYELTEFIHQGKVIYKGVSKHWEDKIKEIRLLIKTYKKRFQTNPDTVIVKEDLEKIFDTVRFLFHYINNFNDIQIEKLPSEQYTFREYVVYCEKILDIIDKQKESSDQLILKPTYKQMTDEGNARIYTENPSVQGFSNVLRWAVVPHNSKNLIYYCDVIAAELMFLAYISDETELIEAYQTNRDVHAVITGHILDITEEQVTENMKKISKSVEYGIVYGSQGYSIANDLNISIDESVQLINKFLKRYQKIDTVKKIIERNFEKEKIYTTAFGRVKYSPTTLFIDEQKRKAINFYVQSGFADLFKTALIKIFEHYKKGFELRTIIHDSFLIEFDPEKINKQSLDLLISKSLSFSCRDKEYSFRTKSGVGTSWGEAEQNSSPNTYIIL